MQLLYFPLRHFNHKKMFEYPINLVPLIIFSEETCAASCAQLLSQTAGVKNSQLLKNVPQYYCKVWEKHPRLEITCQYNIGKLIWLHKWKKIKRGQKRFLQQESSKVVEIEQKKIAQSHQVTPSHTKSHPPHSSCCSTLVLLRSHKRLDFTCIHNYLNQSAVVFVFVCYSFSSS